MKTRLKEMLDDDEYCNGQLKKLEDKGITFDQLWDDKMNSAVSNISICIILLVN